MAASCGEPPPHCACRCRITAFDAADARIGQALPLPDRSIRQNDDLGEMEGHSKRSNADITERATGDGSRRAEQILTNALAPPWFAAFSARYSKDALGDERTDTSVSRARYCQAIRN